MSWLDRLLGRTPTERVGAPTGGTLPSSTPTTPARGLAGGRLSVDFASEFTGFRFLVAPAEPDLEWTLGDFDAQTIRRFSATRLMELLVDLSPEVSRALWDWLRQCNSGWECTAYQPGSDTPHPQAQKALDVFWEQVGENYGAADVPINRLFMGSYIRGGLMAELVLDAAGRLPVDLATPDPASARFLRVKDPVRGPVHELVQLQVGGWVALDRTTIGYVPIDPLPGVPYGRPMISPALFTSLFLLGLLHDLKRVVSQQGYPRLDIAVNSEKLQAIMPADARTSPEALQTWVQAIITEVQTVVRGLQPDDTYVHLDTIAVNRPVGTVDSSSLGAVDGLIQALERMAVRALKTTPLLMALDSGMSEGWSNRLWESHLVSVKSVQHLAEDLIERLLTVGLQAQGIAARVEMRFAENRASEMQRDATTHNQIITNALDEYLAGFTSLDEAAQKVTGHDADVPEPRALPRKDVATVAGDTNPVVPSPSVEEGTNRARRLAGTRADGQAPAVKVGDADLAAAEDFFDGAVPEKFKGLLSAKTKNGHGG